MAATVFVLVWHINLYNFMDGIDGIASSQCLLFCLSVLYLTGGVPGWLGDLLWILVGTALGFLVYNWPPAKIFMGDVGSGALGLILGVVTLQLAISGMLPFIGCLILLTGFWFDASYTLCVRMLSGQAFTEAHRSHLYQKVAAIIHQGQSRARYHNTMPIATAWAASRELGFSSRASSHKPAAATNVVPINKPTTTGSS